MKKPFCATSTEVLEHINPAKPVYVYRNLHKKCCCHAKNVVLKDCDFIVWIAGQTKVRKEKKKNVHAFLFGYVSTSTTANELLDFGWHSVYYNPYACEHWQLENEPFDQYVDRAKWVDVHADSLGASVLAFDIIYKKDLCPA
jgi:hypothetical protein